MSQHRESRPSILTPTKEIIKLKELKFNEKEKYEDDLQHILDKNPAILPIDAINSRYEPFVSLGREIINIDNLFISPEGDITIVETKLWRNRESIREVIGQLLGYATTLTELSYLKFEETIQTAKHSAINKETKLYDFVKKNFPIDTLPEGEFVDVTQRNLRLGRFLLLIVGDKIKESVENMIDFIQKYPALHFTFGLVELRFFENEKVFNGHLIVPQLIAKSIELERQVINVKVNDENKVSVKVEWKEPERNKAGRKPILDDESFKRALTCPELIGFVEQVQELISEIEANTKWGVNTLAVQFPNPRGEQGNLTLFHIYTDCTMNFGYLDDQLKRLDLDPSIAIIMLNQLSDLFQTPIADKYFGLERTVPLIKVQKKYDEFVNIIRNTVEKINLSHSPD